METLYGLLSIKCKNVGNLNKYDLRRTGFSIRNNKAGYNRAAALFGRVSAIGALIRGGYVVYDTLAQDFVSAGVSSFLW